MRLFPSLRRSLKKAADVAATAQAWTQDVWRVQCSKCGNAATMLRRPRRQGACSHRCARKLVIAARQPAHPRPGDVALGRAARKAARRARGREREIRKHKAKLEAQKTLDYVWSLRQAAQEAQKEKVA